ncbi:MAG: hypothetical protein K0R94_698, partial [Burkholderiales bacterium]|nr:hypothetical protein [Burkholderiales bacterium]
MDTIQLLIIATVVALILLTIGYYLYQEAKFKKMVENNFNQATDDIIIEDNKSFTLDGIDTNKQSISNAILQKDMVIPDGEPYNDPLFDMQKVDKKEFTGNVKRDNEASLFATDTPPAAKIPEYKEVIHPEHSVEAFFANIHKIDFPFAKAINPDLDFIVDIGFEEITKIRVLPEISQFTNKAFAFYILDKNNLWSSFNRGEKYVARALKLVVPLVDYEGLTSQVQLSNIYNELHKFVMQNNAHIAKSNYEEAIAKIGYQIKHLEK